jgi:excinuclease UvrABC helicase subunit UvrB
MGRAARYVEGHAILYADVAANPALDFDYARQWAARLRVEDLLARALAEAEP